MIKDDDNTCFLEVLDTTTEPIQVDLLVSRDGGGSSSGGEMKSVRTHLLLSHNANLCPLGVKVPTAEPEDVKAKLDSKRSKVSDLIKKINVIMIKYSFKASFPKLQQHALRPGSVLRARLAHTESPESFYLQPLSLIGPNNGQTLASFYKALNIFYNKAQLEPLRDLEKGGLCVFKSHSRKKSPADHCRGIIQDNPCGQLWQIFLYDSGNSAELDLFLTLH